VEEAAQTALRNRRQGWGDAIAAAATLAIAGAAFLLAYDGGSSSVASRATIAIAAWWALFLAVALALVRPAVPTRATLGVAAFFFLLAGLTLLSAIWGPSAEDAFREFNRVTLYLGVFVLVVVASRWIRLTSWSDGLALALVAVALVALVSRLFPGTFDEGRLPALLPASRTRLSFPVGYWNGLGILTALAVPLLLRIAVSARHAALRGLAVAPLPVLASVWYLASSRGAAVAGCAGALAFLVLTRRRWATFGALMVGGVGMAGAMAVLLTRDELANGPLGTPAAAYQGRSAALLIAFTSLGCAIVYGSLVALAPGQLRIPRSVGWGVAVVLGALILAGVAAARPVERFDDFRRPPSALLHARSDFVRAHFLSGNGSGRWQFWAAAIDEFEHHPLGGGGAGSYESWWAEHGSLAMFVRDAHSLYLETLAELGIGGLLAVVGVFAVGLATAVARVRGSPDRDEALAALAAVVAAYVVAAAIDWMWELTIVSLVGFVALALVTAGAPEPEVPATQRSDARARPGRAQRALAAATALAAVLAIGGHGIALLTFVQLDESQAAARRGDLEAALEEATAARKIQPWAASPYLQLTLVQEQAGAVERARGSIESAIDRDDGDWRLWLVRARVETEAGAVLEAAASLARAAELNPRSPLFTELR